MSKLVHLAEIIITLQYKGFATAAELSAILEVDKKTIYRYIETLIEGNVPIETKKGRNGGFYLDNNFIMKQPDLTERELYSLMLASEILTKEKGFLYEHNLKSAVEKIKNIAGVKNSAKFDIASIESFEKLEDKISKILQAIDSGRSIEIDLFSINKESIKKLIIDPYAVVFKDSQWHVIGLDHNIDKIRSYLLNRIAAAKQTDYVFIKPPDFDLKEYVHNLSETFCGSKIKVVVSFNSKVADIIKNNKWHSSQEINVMEDGTVILKLYLDDLSEFKRWILSFGKAAKVIEPLQLRKEVLEEILGVEALYKDEI